MTESTPTPRTSAPLMAAMPTTVLLRHPSSKGVMWTLMLIYVLAFQISAPLLSILALVTMPLGVGLEHPRRALHLWATGLWASALFVVKARWLVNEWGGLSSALVAQPVATWGLLIGSAVAVFIFCWHLTWVASER